MIIRQGHFAENFYFILSGQGKYKVQGQVQGQGKLHTEDILHYVCCFLGCQNKLFMGAYGLHQALLLVVFNVHVTINIKLSVACNKVFKSLMSVPRDFSASALFVNLNVSNFAILRRKLVYSF